MNGNTMELDKLLSDMRKSYSLEDAKDLTGELDIEALRIELEKAEQVEPDLEESMQAQMSMFERENSEETTFEKEKEENNDESVDTAQQITASKNDTKQEESGDRESDEEDNPGESRIAVWLKKRKNVNGDAAVPDYVAIVHDVTWLLIAVCVLFAFAFRLVGVKGESMEPTLYNGDRLILMCEFLSENYKQGDIVVIVSEKFDVNTPLVKRVIATEGQTIDINFNTGVVTVDGEELNEPYIAEATNRDPGGFEYPVKVPAGCVFVMGDNRNHSTDSRNENVGFVDKDDIVGRVLLRLWPMKRIGK